LLHLPSGRDAHLVEQAMREAIGTLPAQLARSITWDQGIEMSGHAQFTIATGIPVYFCDPHAPWQRGSNENTYWCRMSGAGFLRREKLRLRAAG
jgi:IS30 family transposase